MIGSFPPSDKPESFQFPEEVVPSGMLARGKYRATCRFMDDDGHLHLEFEYTFEIKKDWA
jgi:Rho GDP-dissociation inhibitor